MSVFPPLAEARDRLIHENEIPSLPPSWDVQRFRFLFRESKERNGDQPVGDMLSVSEYRGVIPREYENEEQRRTDDELSNYRVVRPGQLAVNTMWLNHLGLGVSKHLGHVSPAYAVYHISPKLEHRFVHHLLRSQYYLKIYLRYLYGIRPNSFQVKTDDWNSIPIIVPPLAAQKSIAEFLDRETARIDQLIEKKTNFINLLNQKRAATISQVVTKGLDAAEPIKASGVDWIGTIPSSWKIMKLGYLGTCANGINIGGAAFGSGFPFISYSDAYNNRELPPSVSGLVESSDDDRNKYSVRTGDVLFTRTSETVEEIGFSSVCLQTIENAVFAGFLIRFRPLSGKLEPRFSKFAFQNILFRDFFSKEMMLVTRASLSQSLLKKMPVPVPPLEAQRKIAEFLEAADSKITSAVSKTQHSVTLLSELRAALITAAVTGQIDVATWAKQGHTNRRLDRIEEALRA